MVDSPNPTNNVSEAYAILKLLECFTKLGANKYSKLQVIGDSELVIKQVKGQYRVNSNSIRIIYRKVK